MTDLYKSSPKINPKVVIIHGLNNNQTCFQPLKNVLLQRGYSSLLIALPGHSDDRQHARTFSQAFKIFSHNMQVVTSEQYLVIAFSTGALYLQLWMRENPHLKPMAQVLLAPAFFIRRHHLISGMSKLLPSFFFIKSGSPKLLRRYSGLFVWEYRVLMEAISSFQSMASFEIPTLMLVDPKDELVDAARLARYSSQVQFQLMERKYLWRPGHHHIIFHPDYFQDGDWEKMLGLIQRFFQTNAEA